MAQFADLDRALNRLGIGPTEADQLTLMRIAGLLGADLLDGDSTDDDGFDPFEAGDPGAQWMRGG